MNTPTFLEPKVHGVHAGSFRDPFPLYWDSGHGAYVVDADGNERLDFVNQARSWPWARHTATALLVQPLRSPDLMTNLR